MSSTQTETSSIPMPSSSPLYPPSRTHTLGLSNSAYKLTEPLQTHLAPLIVRGDSYANLAVDMVQKTYPKDVMGYVQNRQKDVGEYVRERRESAGVIAHDIDKVAVNRIDSGTQENGTSADKEAHVSEYSRALELSVRLRDQLQSYANEQMTQLQAHSVLVQRATETARSLSNTASSSLSNVQAKLQAVSENMIAELGKFQSQAASLSASLQASASKTIKDPTAQLPPQVQQRYAELSSVLQAQASSASATYAKLSNHLASTEKATKVTHEVSVRVQPLLEVLSRNAQQAIGARGESQSPTVNGVNGHAN
ncbi:uncharacterized protein C8R40DRAFT_1136180 [Lentinula edodes]|uniref:uncharacterized protein n=1 Tax=Lentinula edodes TaxID=5353 RepID=UPI001E8D5159|nr:uncharacterized protein C8R40DRAFT_1136180 [Lentinula edodes]KAH7868094.1 hypothetical protein C8R40DRAFT_1136180 [Lentinula edodes]